MKLLYMWIKNYKEQIKNEEFSFSPEYWINFNTQKSTIKIRKNDKYIYGFYGKNTLDIEAIVGENGSGKTTLTRCLFDMCQGVTPIGRANRESATERIVIYLDEKSELWIFYYLTSSLEVDTEDCKYEKINLLYMNQKELEKAEKAHRMSVVYFTNALELGNIIQGEGMGEYTEEGIKKSLPFSPMIAMQNEMNSMRQSYGAEGRGGILDVINQYAKSMVLDAQEAYLSAFCYRSLLMVRYSPGSIARVIPIFNDFKVSVLEFGYYVAHAKNIYMLSEFDKSVYFIRKNIFDNIIKNLGENNYEKIYANVLCEIALFLNLFNSNYLDVTFQKLEMNVIDISSQKAMQIILDQITDARLNESKALLLKIRNIKAFDISLIDEFFLVEKNKDGILEDTKWYRQIENFRKQYDNKNRHFNIPPKINDGYSHLIEILLESHDQRETLWWRMIKITPVPVSSGEMALINIFASVYQMMKKNTDDNILLILDEIDAFLHPEWQQQILSYITRWINESQQFKDKKVQIVLSSHSPIILSDLTQDRIIKMKNLKRVVGESKLTLGANINQLFYDSFFMENGSIGEIAKSKIQLAIEYTHGSNEISESEAHYIISNIGETIVRHKLQKDLQYRIWTERKND